MKLLHKVTLLILVSIIASAVFNILVGNWSALGMCITAFGGWMIVAKYEQMERKANETISS
jgi:positive regulator of sigma E activity